MSRYCAPCRELAGGAKARTKRWEKECEEWFAEACLNFSYGNKKLPCATTTRYPDWLFVTETHVVLVECDEHEHRYNNAKCEVTRISEFMDSIDGKNLHVIRYNPHGKNNRKKELIEAIHTALGFNFGSLNNTGCVVEYLGYSQNRIQMFDEINCTQQTLFNNM